MKSAEVRFYFDGDVLGLAKVVAELRNDCTYPGDPGAVIHKRARPPCLISPGSLDVVWIPEVASRDWLVVSKDAGIRHHRREIAAVREFGARMVLLSGREARNKWAQLEILLCNWRRIGGLLDLPGPFIYRATRTALSRWIWTSRARRVHSARWTRYAPVTFLQRSP